MCCRGPRRDTQLCEEGAHLVCTMRGLTTRRRAMSSLLIPIATSRSTSTSRSVRPAGRAVSASASSASAWSAARIAGLGSFVRSTARQREAGGITRSAAATTAAVREPTPILR